MKKRITYFLVLFLLLVAYSGFAQTDSEFSKLHLYTDRDYCLSGDTLWFKVWLPKKLEQNSNVAHVQLNSANGGVITTAVALSKEQWVEGFVHVPDSLSSGTYFISAFLNEQRNLELKHRAKTLFVYNRFEEELKEMKVPGAALISNVMPVENQVKINASKTICSTRDKVTGTIEINLDEIEHATLSAKLRDPLVSSSAGDITFVASKNQSIIPAFAEKDGVLISGKVFNEDNNPQKNTLVLLSISSEPPYFDYCISDENGGFNFFLKHATGDAKVVLQAVSSSNNEFVIRPELNSLDVEKELSIETKILNPEQSKFISTIIQANFINKLFNSTRLSSENTFQMPVRYTVPFYGIPTKRVTPAEFFDLPNFKEISRELLHGFQYRNVNNEISFRLLNLSQGNFFPHEPLRLLNGIPVFKNSYFIDLKSTDISYIDIVQSERVFGDIQINGVLSVSLVDKSNSWLAQQSNINSYTIPCLQLAKQAGYLRTQKIAIGEPDIRQNYLWEKLQVSGNKTFEFYLSDLKGEIEITVEGVTKNNQVFKTSKIIEVK